MNLGSERKGLSCPVTLSICFWNGLSVERERERERGCKVLYGGVDKETTFCFCLLFLIKNSAQSCLKVKKSRVRNQKLKSFLEKVMETIF